MEWNKMLDRQEFFDNVIFTDENATAFERHCIKIVSEERSAKSMFGWHFQKGKHGYCDIYRNSNSNMVC